MWCVAIISVVPACLIKLADSVLASYTARKVFPSVFGSVLIFFSFLFLIIHSFFYLLEKLLVPDAINIFKSNICYLINVKY